MATRRRASGFTLVELLVVIIILGILMAILIPAIAGMVRQGKVTKCGNNLKQLWTMQNTYLTQSGTNPRYPEETGGNFWLKLTWTRPPLLEPNLASGPDSMLHCMVKGGEFVGGSTDYRGPAWNINSVQQQFGSGDPIGADCDGNHGVDEGGNVLTRAGGVRNVRADEALWSEATSKTSP